MARPRKSRPPEQTDGIAAAHVDNAALEEAGAAASVYSQQVAQVDQKFSIDIDYQLDVYIAAIRQRAAESAVRLIEIGCMLIQIRERETRETYKQALDRAGLNQRFAQRTMQAALKFKDRRSIQALGVGKALELLSEDDDTLEALEDGGTLAGLTLDDIERMTQRELRDALRAEREKRADEAETAEIKQKEDQTRIDKLLGRSRKTGVEDRGSELLAEAMKDFVGAAMHLRNFGMTIEQIDKHYADNELQVSEDIQAVIDEKVAQVEGFLTDFTAKFGA